MEINEINKQAIHDVLITDIQRRLFKQYNARTDKFNPNDEDYDRTQSMLVDSILHINTISDVNDIVIEYGDLFQEDDYGKTRVFTLDGTLNYIFSLLVKQTELLKCKC